MNDPTRHFPDTYREARANFIKAADRAGLDITTRVHPGAKGPRGRPLFLDVARAGERDAPHALVLISGTHGVEGYFGSAVQTGLLREGLMRRVPPGTRVLLIHAFNPFGFAWNRRVNEDNADLNRNFVQHTKPPRNTAYDTLAPFIAPKDMTPEVLKTANGHLRAYTAAHGAFALQTAISAGQYHHPDGLYFGGQKESGSAAMLRDIATEHLRGVKKMIAIDYHTGLGETGDAEMICEDLPGSPAYARQKKVWGRYVRSNEGGESLSAPLTGTLDQEFARLFPDCELTFAALEVGTAPMRDVFSALRKDNWLHLQKKPERSLFESIKREVRAAFYPDTADWKRKVWQHAIETFEPALAAIA
jgi:hypothetical protein